MRCEGQVSRNVEVRRDKGAGIGSSRNKGCMEVLNCVRRERQGSTKEGRTTRVDRRRTTRFDGRRVTRFDGRRTMRFDIGSRMMRFDVGRTMKVLEGAETST